MSTGVIHRVMMCRGVFMCYAARVFAHRAYERGDLQMHQDRQQAKCQAGANRTGL